MGVMAKNGGLGTSKRFKRVLGEMDNRGFCR